MSDDSARTTVKAIENDRAVRANGSTAGAQTTIIANPWQALRQFTAARIAQGRVGVSMPTDPQLAFQLAHARAQDAVHAPLDTTRLLQDLASAGVAPPALLLQLDSAAENRACYLQRPDLGRRLSPASRERLVAFRSAQQPLAGVPGYGAAPACADIEAPAGAHAYDLALVLADGLSPLAINRQAPPFLVALQGALAAEGWRVAPLTVVQQARVAIGDEIGALLAARSVVVLIGERPGLSASDSMGLYLTWMPRVGLTDARRNCISNVRQAGLAPVEAAALLHQLLVQAFRRQLSGVALKDTSRAPLAVAVAGPQFRLAPPAALAAPVAPASAPPDQAAEN